MPKKIMPIKKESEKVIRKRWVKKRDSIENLSHNIQRLRYNISVDLKSDNDKVFLTALVVAIMMKTAERVGNEESASNGHVGITGLGKKQINVIGNKIILEYVGKSGVEHTKMFSDEKISKALKKALKLNKSKFAFTTSDGFKIKSDRINRYLSDFGVTAKDIRGYSANDWAIKKLKEVQPEDTEYKRKRQFNKIIRRVAEKVGHGMTTLKNHYLVPELEPSFIEKSIVINVDDLSKYNNGGDIVVGEKKITPPNNPCKKLKKNNPHKKNTKGEKGFYEKLYKEHHNAWSVVDEIETLSSQNKKECFDKFVSLWDSELNPHFKKEEDVLFPDLIKKGHKSDVDDLLKEHKEFYLLVDKIKKSKTNHVEDIKKFSSMIKEHIKKEEGVMELFYNDPYHDCDCADKDGVIYSEEFKSWFGDWEVLVEARKYFDNVKGIYKNLIKENTEIALFELAQQSITSRESKDGAIRVAGKELVELALKLYPSISANDSYFPVVSKMVDEEGFPLVVYHYSPKEFNVFDKNKHPKIANHLENKYHKHLGYDFSTKEGFFKRDNSVEYKVFLNVKNLLNIKYANEYEVEPLIKILSSLPHYSYYEHRKADLKRDIENLKNGEWDILEIPSIEKYLSKKYDGLIMAERDWINIKVYDNKNIKLADGTNTTFDVNNPDIRFKEGGRVSKDGYERKREWAAKRMAENKKNDSLTEEQHEALDNLCAIRHDIHSNKKSVIISDDAGLKKKLISANEILINSELTPMSFVPKSNDDYIDIDTINELYEGNDIPEDEDERQTWYDSNYYRISAELEELNGKIEDYLREIDRRFGTNYCPSGMSRFKEGGETIAEIFGLSKPETLEDIENGVDEILLQYSGRKMASIQINQYLLENKELGIEYIKNKKISSREEFDRFLSNRQSVLRSGVREKRKKSLLEHKRDVADFHVSQIEKMALAASDEMDKKIRDYDDEMDIKIGDSVEKNSVGGDLSDVLEKEEITFKDFHIDTFANFKKIKSKELPTKEPNFVSNSGSKYWYVEDSVYRQSDHWMRTVASCNWLLDGCAKKDLSQGVCKLSDFKRQRIELLKRESEGKVFRVGKTSLIRNGRGCMHIEENSGTYLRETPDYYIFDTFKVAKHTIAYVIPVDEMKKGGCVINKIDIPNFYIDKNNDKVIIRNVFHGTCKPFNKFEKTKKGSTTANDVMSNLGFNFTPSFKKGIEQFAGRLKMMDIQDAYAYEKCQEEGYDDGTVEFDDCVSETRYNIDLDCRVVLVDLIGNKIYKADESEIVVEVLRFAHENNLFKIENGDSVDKDKYNQLVKDDFDWQYHPHLVEAINGFSFKKYNAKTNKEEVVLDVKKACDLFMKKLKKEGCDIIQYKNEIESDYKFEYDFIVFDEKQIQYKAKIYDRSDYHGKESYEMVEYKSGGEVKNPYAICTASIGKKEGVTKRSNWSKDTEGRYEKCVLSIKSDMRDGGTLTIDKKGIYENGKPLRDMTLDEVSKYMSIYHEEKGNFLVAKNSFYLWFYDTVGSGQKIESGEYDFLMFPLPTRRFDQSIVDDIWKRKWQKDKKGAEKLLGMAEGFYNEENKKVFVLYMSVRPSARRNRINTFMIKFIKHFFKTENVEFHLPTKDGKLFISGETYSQGGNLEQYLKVEDSEGKQIAAIKYSTHNKDRNISLFNMIAAAQKAGYEVSPITDKEYHELKYSFNHKTIQKFQADLEEFLDSEVKIEQPDLE